MGQLIFFALLLVLMWVVLILPQQRRVRAHQSLVSSLDVGDEVMTTSGLYGTIIELDGDDVRLQVAPEVELRFARGAIAQRVSSPDEPIAGELDDVDADELDAAAADDDGQLPPA
jgi:preprotein translocase subunit YajC